MMSVVACSNYQVCTKIDLRSSRYGDMRGE